MKKIINNVENIAAEMVSGFVKTNPDKFKQLPETLAVARVGLKSIFETGFKRHSEPRLPSTAQINH
ncbi:hypothetical protein [Pediococcus parvulus]|uniref:hypothetical protein n=1 Tax=Pediococcus parvulus TaxID=54062 RepID=UPI0021A8EE38|nr:hypothetical protein [Pediococcus parvulus]MCT3032033.1 hypothetical protein [Pediococcus parvulus]